MMGLMVVMFYFLLIRPQQRQRKEQAGPHRRLQNGDKVVTTAGIHGIVHNVKEHTVVGQSRRRHHDRVRQNGHHRVHKKDAAK
jgi:preprotein translocase YajC subunit